MAGMADHISGGPDVYSLAEAAQDRWVDPRIDQAAQTGKKVEAARRPWAR